MKIVGRILVFLSVVMTNSLLHARVTPVHLRCEYRMNPLGIDMPAPRLSWQLESGDRAQSQSAYQILAAQNATLLAENQGDVWDSGKIESNRQNQIAYAGNPLQSGQRIFWKVRVWDGSGVVSDYSAPAWWEMGLLKSDDWQGQWIALDEPAPATDRERYGENPVPLFRKSFSTNKEIKSARAYVCGLGYYEMTLNGQRIGDHWLDPAWTAYGKRVFYSTYDVTGNLQQGENVVGLMLGNGWYNPTPMPMFGAFPLRKVLTIGEPRAIVQLNIDYIDGSRETIFTDSQWKTAKGPILKNGLYLGELYDARREIPGWDRSGFDDSHWKPAAIAREPIGRLEAQPLPPIRITKTLPAKKITEPTPGVFIVDLGQNFAGTVRLQVKGTPGTKVQLRYGELLYEDGTLNGMTSVYSQMKNRSMPDYSDQPFTAFQIDTYILKGEGVEEYTPRFTYRGFRYVELTGFPGKPDLNTLTGLQLHTDVESAGEFTCSNDLFDRIQEMTRWTVLSNLHSVQTDCPHREKLGYGGDIIATSEMSIFNFDMAAFYSKVVHDFADEVRPNGGFTETAPYVGIESEGLGQGTGPIGWATVHPVLLWNLYQYYGDIRLIEEQYDAAKNWLHLLQEKAEDSLIKIGLSDHESLVPKPVELTGTAFYYYNAQLLERLARILNRLDDAKQFLELSDTIKEAFNRHFLDRATGKYGSGTQACQAFALYMDLVPDELRSSVLDSLVKDIVETQHGALTTGIFGTKYMLLSLSDLGKTRVAYDLVNRKEFPGWGFMLQNGATTLWEHWEFSDNTFSHNHPMFGSVSEWFFKYIAGIQPAPNAVGFDSILIRPFVDCGETEAQGEYRSIRGVVKSEWKKTGNDLSLSVVIPPNTTATVFVPALSEKSVRENGQDISRSEGIHFLRMEGKTALFEIGSGQYRFVSENYVQE